MLDISEKQILNIFLNIYQMNINNNINYNKKDYNIIFDIKTIPDKLVNIFFKELKEYINIILEDAILYSILNDDTNEYFSFIKVISNEDINNINNLKVDIKRELVYKSIKFILDKSNNKIDLYKVQLSREKYYDLFSNINNNYRIYNINDFEIIIIYKIIYKYKMHDIKSIVKDIIYTNKYDNDIKKFSYNIFNDNNILFFKNYILKKLFFNTYLDEYNKKLIYLKNNNLNYLGIDNLVTPFDKHLNYCINNNKYFIPKELENDILDSYISIFHNKYKEKKYIELIEKTNKKKLIKLNPFYKLS